MFLSLFYLLRSGGIRVSMNEWMTLMEGLNQGLHGSTLSGFYTLCKAVVVHSEADYDKFDQIFLEYFKSIQEQAEVPDEVLSWLKNAASGEDRKGGDRESTSMSRQMIEELFAERLKDQTEEHDGGRKWIGTGGYTAYGNRGKRQGGIRVGEESGGHSAYRVIGERKYRDWRWDNTLDIRQFQVAFRKLRQLMAESEGCRTALDINGTIRKTCDHAGKLNLEYTYPRKNGIKVLMLIDSGGSMETYQLLCSMLFQSVQKAGDFKELKIYYFHNVLRTNVYLEPTCDWRSGFSLNWILKNLPSDYRVIFVGDAIMAPDELLYGKSGNTGLANFRKIKSTYTHIIWLHPQPRPAEENYFTRTFTTLEQLFDMYQLTVEGVSAGMKKLIVNR